MTSNYLCYNIIVSLLTQANQHNPNNKVFKGNQMNQKIAKYKSKIKKYNVGILRVRATDGVAIDFPLLLSVAQAALNNK